jgi:hypothetical protein
MSMRSRNNTRQVTLGVDTDDKQALRFPVPMAQVNRLKGQLEKPFGVEEDAKHIIATATTQRIAHPQVTILVIDDSDSMNLHGAAYSNFVGNAGNLLVGSDGANGFIKLVRYSFRSIPMAGDVAQVSLDGMQYTPMGFQTTQFTDDQNREPGGITQQYDCMFGVLNYAEELIKLLKAAKRAPKSVTVVKYLDGGNNAGLITRDEVVDKRRSQRRLPINVVFLGIRPEDMDDEEWAAVDSDVASLAKDLTAEYEVGPIDRALGLTRKSMTLADYNRRTRISDLADTAMVAKPADADQSDADPAISEADRRWSNPLFDQTGTGTAGTDQSSEWPFNQ